ncbi:MAG: ABC transporter ATP-binding protein [Natronospirillum sp.]|uniref:ABC transporter ATP-binding protein n=1 Tax=Natronospirillum sp. TaxID=2812955 RepID=UPI0025F2712B|nr:ABC transporter ATP-binding protein [Natronospirillum sp.]MCH8550765.1 ABC transporter ATP-binding protein [Natronospirillum sp.]
MLQLEGLSKYYGKAVALRDLSLELEEGEVLCVLGPSGCGKSTLLKLISGLDNPDAGSIRVNGNLIASAGFSLPPERRPVNMVFQDYALWPHMKVRTIVGYGLNHLSRPERRKRVDELLDLLQIRAYADRLPGQLSGGQQQRVAIARALATDPDLLLFDEPLSNLDVQLRLEMRHELADLFQRLDKTVIYVTHDPLEACAFADRLLVLRNGLLEQLGPTRSLFETPVSPWVAALAGYDSRLSGEALEADQEGLWRVLVSGQFLRVKLQKSVHVRSNTPLSVMLHPSAIEVQSRSDRPVGEAPAALDTAQHNELMGKVLQCIYEGRSWRLRLDLGQTRLSLVVPEPYTPGTELTVRFPVQDTLGFV